MQQSPTSARSIMDSAVRSLNFFHITDQIYSAEPPKATVKSQASLRPRALGLTHTEAVLFNKCSMRAPYLVPREAQDPGSRIELLHALRKDLRAFYFHKQRHLFKPKNFAFEERTAPLPRPPQKKTRSHSPLPFIRKTTPSPLPTKGFSPPPPKGRRLEFNASIKTLVGKCRSVRTRDRLQELTEEGRQRLRAMRKGMDWTREVLDQVTGCEASVLLPYFETQREALASFHEDVRQFAEEHQRATYEAKATARFAQLLHSCKNLVI